MKNKKFIAWLRNNCRTLYFGPDDKKYWSLPNKNGWPKKYTDKQIYDYYIRYVSKD